MTESIMSARAVVIAMIALYLLIWIFLVIAPQAWKDLRNWRNVSKKETAFNIFCIALMITGTTFYMWNSYEAFASLDIIWSLGDNLASPLIMMILVGIVINITLLTVRDKKQKERAKWQKDQDKLKRLEDFSAPSSYSYLLPDVRPNSTYTTTQGQK